MSAVIGTCELCGHGILDGSAAFLVTGWEAQRRAGGTNHVLDRKRTPNRVAHTVCIEARAGRRKAGIAEGQERLI